uniref:Tail sheath protein n=1 Tax=Myoviridae sp. ctj3P51 TaxID=2826687 RepID=A0A8S5NQZ6_9CAUD|nr:MAG TPA: Protein of unknown function (DUF3383) [Myoviridae sp. ctj3P51]
MTIQKGDLLFIDRRQYRVLKINGTIATLLSMTSFGSAQPFYTENQTDIYANSVVDNYCNTTFYNSLSENLRGGIVPTTFRQDEWDVAKASDTTPKYQFNLSREVSYTCTNSSFGDSLTRFCYLLSIQDILDYLDATPEMTFANTTITAPNIRTLFFGSDVRIGGWFAIGLRSITKSSGSTAHAYILDYRYTSVSMPTTTSILNREIRPAFQVDLSKIHFIKENQSMIDLRNFVDVKITKAQAQPVLQYDTAIFCSTTGNAAAGYYLMGAPAGGDGTKAKPFNEQILNAVGDKDLITVLTAFSANGGKYIHLLRGLVIKDGGWFDSKNNAIPQEEAIIIVKIYANSPDTKFLPLLDTVSGIQQKIIIGVDLEYTSVDSANLKEGFAVCTTWCAGAAMAAYLTNINLDLADSVKDFNFTAIKGFTPSDEAVSLTDKVTVVAYLAGAYRAIGGEDVIGNSITNIFMKIVLTQTLTNRLLSLLMSKIKLDMSGIASVKTVCANVLKQFVNNGYISTDKAWTEPDLYVDGELVAAENTPLVDGYKIHVSAITQTNIQNHQIPPVYILYGDQVSVRKIVVTGEVF